jgi:hypothetical protein
MGCGYGRGFAQAAVFIVGDVLEKPGASSAQTATEMANEILAKQMPVSSCSQAVVIFVSVHDRVFFRIFSPELIRLGFGRGRQRRPSIPFGFWENLCGDHPKEYVKQRKNQRLKRTEIIRDLHLLFSDCKRRILRGNFSHLIDNETRFACGDLHTLHFF